MSDDVTMKDFESLIEQAYKLKAEKEEFESKAEAVGATLTELQTKLLAYMEQFDKTSYKSKFGNIIRAQKSSVKVPKDPEAKALFFKYLESKGIKDDILTVNSQTLNSFYKAERDAAIAAGAEEFSIPGLEAPTAYFQLQMRK
jgi:hypothetical protein